MLSAWPRSPSPRSGRSPSRASSSASRMQKQGRSDAFLSAGNTGATLAASTVLLGLHDGVERATVATLFPTGGEPVLVLDGGANLDCSAKELAGFAYLGTVYMRDLLGRPNPVVGLLNVGEEEEKGTAVVREAHQLLKQAARLHYAGNIEGRDILPGPQRAHPCGRGGLRRLRRQHRAQVLRVGGARVRRADHGARARRLRATGPPGARQRARLLRPTAARRCWGCGASRSSATASSSPTAVKNGDSGGPAGGQLGPQRAHRAPSSRSASPRRAHDRHGRSPRSASVGVAVPAGVLTNVDLSRMLDTSDEWIVERTGIRERHIARPDESVAMLSRGASERALAAAGITAGQLDAIVLATASPDRLLPSTACDLQALLGAENAAAFDIGAACPGYIFALTVAEGLIASGQARRCWWWGPRSSRPSPISRTAPPPFCSGMAREPRWCAGRAGPAAASSPPSSSRTGGWRRCSTAPAAARWIRSAKRWSASAPTT